jgi:hypothetical protein
MDFTENQKRIFFLINISNQPYSLLDLMRRHFQDKGLIINKGIQNVEIINNMGLLIDTELKDLFWVFNYVQEKKMVHVGKEAPSEQHWMIVTVTNTIKNSRQDLSQMLNPYWHITISPTFVLDDFIKRGYKTLDEIRLEEERNAREKEKELNETRLKEERNAREIEMKARKGAQKLTIAVSLGAVILSAVIQLITANKERDVFIKNPTPFPDTVKVLYYNQPNDTGFQLQKRK